MLFDLGRSREAIEEYLLEIEQHPDCASSHANIGAANYNLGNLADAVSAIRSALSINPELAHAYYVLSYVQQAKNNYYSARESILEAIRLSNSADNQHRLAQIYAWNEDREGTLEATASALQIDPKHVPSILLRGKVLIQLGEHDQAQKLFTSALNLSPEVAEAHHALGKLRLQRGDVDSAISLLSEARRLDPLYVNDKRAIAEAYGLNLPLFRFINDRAARWHLWPFARKWQVAVVLTLVFCLASKTIDHRYEHSGSVSITIMIMEVAWLLFCVLLANFFLLPYTLPQLAKGAALLRSRRQLDASWLLVGYELTGWLKALLLIGVATTLGLIFAGGSALPAMIFATSTCMPLISAPARAKGKRAWLARLIGVPLCLSLSSIVVLGILLHAYAGSTSYASYFAWPLILVFFAITFFCEKIAILLCRTKPSTVNTTH